MKKMYIGMLAVVSVAFLTTSCSSIIRRADPVVDQTKKEFGVRVELEEKYSPKFSNTIIFPVRVPVDGRSLELAYVSISGKSGDDKNAVLTVTTNWDNFERYHKNVVNLKVTNELPNRLGHLNRLRTRHADPFITVPALWSMAIATPASSEPVADVSRVNGIVYTPVLGADGSLPDKLYFGGVVRLDLFNQNKNFELAAMVPVELMKDGIVFAVAGLMGAGDQSVGEFPGIFVFFELNALKAVAKGAGIVSADVDIKKALKDQEYVYRADNKRRKVDEDEIVEYFTAIQEKSRQIDFL